MQSCTEYQGQLTRGGEGQSHCKGGQMALFTHCRGPLFGSVLWLLLHHLDPPLSLSLPSLMPSRTLLSPYLCVHRNKDLSFFL